MKNSRQEVAPRMARHTTMVNFTAPSRDVRAPTWGALKGGQSAHPWSGMCPITTSLRGRPLVGGGCRGYNNGCVAIARRCIR